LHQARRPKRCLLATQHALQMLVAEKLHEQRSPQQVAGSLKTMHGDDSTMRVSHETIYKSLFIQARGVHNKELLAGLRSKRLMRRARTATRHGQPRGQIIDAVSIRQRPAEIEDRAVPGHWEGDLLSGGKNTHIATLVERHSRFLMLVHVAGKDSDSVVRALTRQVQQLPQGLMSSLTWDRGWSSQTTSALPSRLMLSSTSAILAVHGSVEATRTPTASYVSTFPRAPTSQDTVKPTSMPWPSNSTRARERPLASEHQALPSP
jgi:IS30 family transposase